jgi:putative hydrolase of the HAD superfamily
VRAVTLDAEGTLIAVAEPVGETYARLAARHGIVRVPADIERDFRRAFATAPPLAFPGASPGRLADHERAWWYVIVRQAFGPAADAAGFDACFAELFAHYAQSHAWRVFPDVVKSLAALRAEGARLAVVSNFDARLPSLLDGLGLGSFFDRVVYSSRAGAAKPAPGIFRHTVAALDVSVANAVHAGDRVAEDVEGALAAGMQAVLVDRADRQPALPPGVSRIRTLVELVRFARSH